MAVTTRRNANGTMASYQRSVTRLVRQERGNRDKTSIGFWPIGGDTAGDYAASVEEDDYNATLEAPSVALPVASRRLETPRWSYTTEGPNSSLTNAQSHRMPHHLSHTPKHMLDRSPVNTNFSRISLE